MQKWAFRWRGYLLLPLALLAIAIGRTTPLSYVVGLIPVLLGEGLRIWAVCYAGSTTRESELVAPSLVTAGPYAYVRNPLYLGNAMIGFGFCIIATGACTLSMRILLFSLFIIFYLSIYSLIVGAEEEFLRETFGQEYIAYTRHVPRLIPRLVPYKNRQGSFDWRMILRAEIHTFLLLFLMIAIMTLKLERLIL